MKKIIVILLVACIIAGSIGVLAACKGDSKTQGFTIVTTIFPLYDWIKNIVGDKANVVMLVDNGVDLHSYSPTVRDIATLAQSDLFVYVGGESDGWVHDALRTAARDVVSLNLLDTLGSLAQLEEDPEGAEEEHEHEEEEEEEEYDEHIWLSPVNASVLVQAIADKVAQLDSANADLYRANATAYKAQLNALDAEYREAVSSATVDSVLFGDRFPFLYMTKDYGLHYYAAFRGCSAESEASFETIIFLAGKVDELHLPAILKLESSDGRIARTVRDNTTDKNQPILSMDSLQSTTIDQARAGKTYLGAMRDNLAVLRSALGL